MSLPLNRRDRKCRALPSYILLLFVRRYAHIYVVVWHITPLYICKAGYTRVGLAPARVSHFYDRHEQKWHSPRWFAGEGKSRLL